MGEVASSQRRTEPQQRSRRQVRRQVGRQVRQQVPQQVQQERLHNFEAIWKDADISILDRMPSDVWEHLQDENHGLLLNQKKKKYWVDEKLNNCFMVYPRALTITWADSAKDNRYWHWTSLEDGKVFIDAAELLNVCWLDVQGKIDSTMLSPGTLYEVVFIVKLKQAAYGWRVPVNVRFTLPDGSKQQERKAVDLNKIPREEWREIPVGEFTASPGLLGNIEFSMYEHESGQWKSGLLIKGVAVRPKNKEGKTSLISRDRELLRRTERFTRETEVSREIKRGVSGRLFKREG